MSYFNSIISAFYPNLCISCGEIIPEGEYLCEYCDEMIKAVDFIKLCKRCGMSKKDCLCGKRVFHFSGCAAPYFNEGVAQDAMYRFKFGHKDFISKFFAERMSITVKSCYSNVDFDVITFVPTTFRKKSRRGFNQSELMARRISKILDIKLCGNLLICKGGAKIQHTLKTNDRFNNVKGRFIANRKYALNGKTVLLVDDIKTTGATLDECAKQLLLLGADEVYCITGLMTDKKREKEGK